MPLLPTFEAALALRHDRLCLDFCNSAGNHASAELSAYLVTYADLLAWADRLALLPAPAAARLRVLAARSPARAYVNAASKVARWCST